MKSSKQGICHICGKEAILTFEHVPPYSVFNQHTIRGYTGEQLVVGNSGKRPWDMSGLKYRLQQGGSGFHSLCETCNNNTGAWYGRAYAEFCHGIAYGLHQQQDIQPNDIFQFGLKQAKPLAIIKQMLSLFCSINEAGFADGNLQAFLQDRYSNDLNKKKYRLCVYLTKDHQYRYAGFTGLLRFGEADYQIILVSEITAFPIGMVLYIDPADGLKLEGADITDFADCKYDVTSDIEMALPLRERNTLYPLDYRLKAEIEKCVQENEQWCKENNVEL